MHRLVAQRAIVDAVAKPSGRDIRAEVLIEARRLIQHSGVSRLSYGVLADRLGVRAPSIHHHFGRKDELVADVVARYRSDFEAQVDAIDESDPCDRLLAYAGLFDEVARAGLLCLCGAVAAEWDAVADDAQQDVAAFFDAQLTWLVDQIEQGQTAGRLRPDIDTASFAASLLAALEGSLLLHKTGRPPVSAITVTETLLAGVAVGGPTV